MFNLEKEIDKWDRDKKSLTAECQSPMTGMLPREFEAIPWLCSQFLPHLVFWSIVPALVSSLAIASL